MVKGVNRTVIEVNNTGSEVFERIIFYVTPKYGNLNSRQLQQAVNKFTVGFEGTADRGYKPLRRRMLRKRRIFLGCLFLAAAAVITAVLMLIF